MAELIKRTPTFYSAVDIPDLVTLNDVLFWIALRRVPQSDYDLEGIESRVSDEDIHEGLQNFGDRLSYEFTDSEKEKAGLGDSPWEVHEEREANGKRFLHTPSFYNYQFADQDSEYAKEFEKEKVEDVAEAVEFEKFSQNYEERFNDFFEVARSRLFLALHDGLLCGFGIEVSTAAESEDVWDDIWCHIDKEGYNRVPISKEKWRLQDVDCRASWLWQHPTSYLAVVVPTAEMFEVFPPDGGVTQTVERIGDYLKLSPDSLTVTPPIRRRGRPTKDWNMIGVKVAETIASSGSLPVKKSAFADELCGWYLSETGTQIGRSTMMEKLTPFYSSKSIQKI